MSLRRIVMGTAAMSSVSMLRLLAQFFALPILSRLLSPADYGLIGIAMPFVLFAMLLADAGIGMSLVRVPQAERRVWSTAFWVSILFGAGLAAIMMGFAPLAAYVFEEPKLTPIVMALSLAIFAQALATIPGAALQQAHRFKAIALVEVASVALGIGLAVVLAMHGAGAWALVAQQLAFFTVRFSVTFFLSPFRPLWVFNLKEVKSHLSFGRDVLGVNVVNFLSRSTDNLIIGKIIDAAAVGIYAMAFQFARLPMMLVAGPLQYVLYAQLAPMKDDRQAIGRTFLILTRMLAILIFPAMGMIAISHGPLFDWLLSPKWYKAGHLFMLVALGSAVQAVTCLGGTVRLVMGRTDLQLRSTLEFGVLWVAMLLVAAFYGLASVAVVFSAAVLLYTPRQLQLLLPLIECRSWAYLQTFVIPSLVTAVCMVAYYEIVFVTAPPELVQIAVAALLAFIGIGVSALLQRRFIREEITLWRRTQQKPTLSEVSLA